MSGGVRAWFDEMDNTVEISGLKDKTTGAYINNGTFEVTIKDRLGATVSGDTFPKAMTYVSASNAVYRANVEQTIQIDRGKLYLAHIDGVAGGRTYHGEVEFVPIARA